MAKVVLKGTVADSQPFRIEYELPNKFLANTSAVAFSAWLDIQKYKLIQQLSEEGCLYNG